MQMLTQQQRQFTELESRVEAQRVKAEPVEYVKIMEDEDIGLRPRSAEVQKEYTKELQPPQRGSSTR